MSAISRSSRRAVPGRLAPFVLASIFVVGAPSVAGAAGPPHSLRVFGERATTVASRYEGTPYLWGGTTPRGFDCSGYTRFVYAKLGKAIPRVSQAQYDGAHKVGHRVVEGDLIFFFAGHTRRVHHVGIYAGHGKVWHAPKPGARVRLEKRWTSRWAGGRY